MVPVKGVNRRGNFRDARLEFETDKAQVEDQSPRNPGDTPHLRIGAVANTWSSSCHL